MDVFVTIITNIANTVVGFFNGTFEPNEAWILPVLLGVGIGFLFLPSTKPKKFNSPLVAYVLWSISAGMIVLLFRGTNVDATLTGLLALVISTGIIAKDSFGDSKIKGVVFGAVAVVILVSAFSLAAASPEEGVLSPAIMAIRSFGLNIWTSITGRA